MSTRRAVVTLFLGACCASRLAAQDALSQPRARTELTDEDRVQIRAFVSDRISQISDTDAETARQAAAELRAAHTGTDAFKKAYATLCIEAVRAAYGPADLVPATRLVTVINTFNTPAAQPLLTEALQDKRVGVRAAAAIGLRQLRSQLALAGAEFAQRAWSALKEAGRREKSCDTLKTIYAAMDYAQLPAPPDARGNAGAVLELLEARAAQYANPTIPALGADDAGLRLANHLLPSMDAAQRDRLAIVLGQLMKRAIELYTAPGQRLSDVRDTANRKLLEQRNGIERLILVGEKLLLDLLQPSQPPAITANMRKLNTPDMKNEWAKWVTALQERVKQDFSLAQPAGADAVNAENE